MGAHYIVYYTLFRGDGYTQSALPSPEFPFETVYPAINQPLKVHPALTAIDLTVS